MPTSFLLVLAIGALAISSVGSNGPGAPEITQHEEYRLTHELVACGPVPTAQDPNGVYPYVSYCETSGRPVPKRYGWLVLENDRMTVTIAPDLGGKVMSIVHKGSGKEVL